MMMSFTRAGTIVSATLLLTVVAALPSRAQNGSGPPNVSKRLSAAERLTLTRMVDALSPGQPASGDAWLSWQNHFLKGVDGKTYVPFTLTIEEAPGAFQSMGVYIRVVARGEQTGAHGVPNLAGVRTGEVPVSVPERQFGPAGAPVAGENSAILSSLSAKPAARYLYEDAYGVDVPAGVARDARFQRAIAVPPGEYDVYVAVRERTTSAGGAARPKSAVLTRGLTVPDLSKPRLLMSSVIVADHVEPLAAPVKPAEQMLRPYAFGSAEIIPASRTEFFSTETLNVAFFAYNTAVDRAGKPDVTVEYRLYELAFPADVQLGVSPPQRLDAATLPSQFDVRAGHLVAPTQSIPLAKYGAGAYRLEITVTDNLAATVVTGSVRFTIKATDR